MNQPFLGIAGSHAVCDMMEVMALALLKERKLKN